MKAGVHVHLHINISQTHLAYISSPHLHARADIFTRRIRVSQTLISGPRSARKLHRLGLA